MQRSDLRLAAAIVLLLVASVTLSAIPSMATSAQNEQTLVLNAIPPRLPTNSSGTSTFPALVVSLDDSHGQPAVSLSDTVVYLSSSVTAVLTVQPTVTILAGHQYAVANVTTAETPGNSTITAVSPGIEAGSTTISTFIARGYPSQLSVYPLPPTFAAGQVSNATYAVVVEDAAGLPAKTIADTQVHVTSSNLTVVLTHDTSISVNETVGYGVLDSQGARGAASVTASASGLVSSTTLVSVLPILGKPAGPAAKLQISAPSNLPADGGTYQALTVSLLDNGSNPVRASTPIQVFLTSSRTDLVSVPPSVSIAQGSSFVLVPVKTTAGAGAALITASALNVSASTVPLETDSIPPTQLGIYLAESHSLVSAQANTMNVVVQLQDSNGIPAEARTQANVIVSFSNGTINTPLVTLNISKGFNLKYAVLPISQGTSGTFTAISNGLASASVKLDATNVPITLNLGAAKSTILSNETTPLYFSVQSFGLPVSGANLTWSATDGSISPSISTTDSGGSASAIFTPAGPGVATIRVSASSPLIGTKNSTTTVVVIAYPKASSTSLLGTILGNTLYLGAIVGGVAAAVVVALIAVRRRRRSKVDDEDSFDIGPAPGEGTAFDLRPWAIFRS